MSLTDLLLDAARVARTVTAESLPETDETFEMLETWEATAGDDAIGAVVFVDPLPDARRLDAVHLGNAAAPESTLRDGMTEIAIDLLFEGIMAQGSTNHFNLNTLPAHPIPSILSPPSNLIILI